MVRPRRLRMIERLPDVCYFKPVGVHLREIEEIVLTVSEFESLRLKDYVNLKEVEAAEKMSISQPTFNRLYSFAKKKIVKAFVEGLAIKIEGGDYKMPNRDGTGPEGRGPRTGRGLGNCKPLDEENDVLVRPARLGFKGRNRVLRRKGLGRGR